MLGMPLAWSLQGMNNVAFQTQVGDTLHELNKATLTVQDIRLL
jgi:hypothetical protein